LADFRLINSDLIICENSSLNYEVLTELDVKSCNSRANLLTSTSNLGYGKTINNAIISFNIQDNYDYLVLWNSDCELHLKYFNEIVDSIKIDNRKDVIAPRLFDGQGFYYGSALSWNLLTTKIIRDEYFNYMNSLSWPTAAALFLPTFLIENKPLFDPFFFMYWEDADLMHNLKKKGIVISNFINKNNYYFFHVPGYSSSSNVIKRYLWHLDGHRYFIKKNLVFSGVPIFLLNCKYLLKAFFDGDFKRLIAIFNFITK
jgi:GT2 family glycosyltransferase